MFAGQPRAQMSFLAKVGHFLAGSNDSLSDADDVPLTDMEQSYLEEALNTMQTARLLEDRRTAAHSLIAFARLHRMVPLPVSAGATAPAL